MAVSKDEIRDWISRADDGDEYMIVHSDGFSYEYYPTFHESREEVEDEIHDVREQDMHSIREIYDLNGDIEHQLSKNRAFAI